MANSTTNIDQLATSQRSKEARINANFDAASPGMIFGRQASGCSALTWAYYGGAMENGSGIIQVANGTVTLTASQTNYIEADANGVVTKNTTGFTEGKMPLYTAVCDTNSVTSYTDYRTGAQGQFQHKKHIVTLTYAATLDIDWKLGYDVVRVTATGNLSLNFQNGVDGQVMIVEVTQGSGGNKSVSLPGSVRYSADIPTFTPSTTAGKMDKLGFMCVAPGSPNVYDLMAVVKGY